MFLDAETYLVYRDKYLLSWSMKGVAVIVIQEKLNSRQKRNIFKERFGERLLSQGFIFKNNEFYRIHPGQVFLVVALGLWKGNTFIQFNALPLCVGFTNKGIATIHERVDSFCRDEEERRYLLRPMEFERGRFDKQYDMFFDRIFHHFNEVHDVRSLLEFQEGFIGRRPANDRIRMLECIQLGEYERATVYIDYEQQFYAKSLESRKRTLDQMRETSTSRKEDLEVITASFEEFKAYVESASKELDKWTAWISNKEYVTMQRIIDKHCQQSDEVLSKMFPVFY